MSENLEKILRIDENIKNISDKFGYSYESILNELHSKIFLGKYYETALKEIEDLYCNFLTDNNAEDL